MQKRHGLKIASGLVMGSSMLLMSLLPAASAMAATAPYVSSVTLSGEQGIQAVGNTVSFTANAVQGTGSGTAMYQFWYQGTHGNWHGGSWSSSNTFSLPPLQSGSYEVVAYAMDKGQTTPVSSESTMSNQFVNVNSTLKISTNASSVAPLTPVTISAQSTNLTNPVYQYWLGTPNGNGGYNWAALNVNGSNGDYSPATSATFTPPNAGNYQIAVYAKDLNAPQTALFSKAQALTEAVYGTASAVKLSAATSSLVADGQATDTITATVVDSNGNTVGNFNGSATLDVPSGDGTVTSSTLNFTNGVGTATLTAPSSVPSSASAITVSGLTPANASALTGINYGTGITLTYTAANAASLSLTPVLNAVSSNGNNQDTVNVQLLDQAGKPLPSGNGSNYVTFTISGPGSFADGSSQTTLSEYVTSGQTVPLDVYSVQGSPGTITVSASGAGLTTASTTIQSEATTVATEAGITSQTATLSGNMTVNGVILPAGTQYTIYTVQVEDASGVAVPSAQTFALSDNTSPEALYYYGYANSALGSSLGSSPSVTTSSTTGQAQFAVFNTTSQSTPATITATDSSLTDSTATATYNFYVGSASQLHLNTPYTSVEAGKAVTYTVQLQDAAGNNVSTAGQTINFYLTGNSTTGATVDGSTGWTAQDPYTATTNSQGQASVTVNVPSGTAGDAYTMNAVLPSPSSSVSQSTSVVMAGTYATQVGLSSQAVTTAGATPTAAETLTLPTSMTSGQTLASNLGVASVYALAENSLGEVANSSDTLQITSSNPNVLAISNAASGTTSVGAGSPLPTITAEQSGSATLTIQDLSNPAMPQVTTTINVGAGAAADVSAVNPNGTQDTAYTFPSTAGIVGPFTLQVQDAGGNMVPLTQGPVTLTANAVDSILGLANGTAIRTSSGGGDVTSVTIPNDQSSMQVWVDNGSGTLNSASTTATTPVPLNTEYPLETGATVSGTTLTVTFNNPLQTTATSAQLASEFAISGGITASAASVSGNTVTLTLSSAPALNSSVTFTEGNTTATEAYLADGYSAPVQTFTAAITNIAATSATVSLPTTMTAGTASNVTFTVNNASFTGTANVTIDGDVVAPNTTSYGSFGGTTLTGAKQTVPVSFTNGSATVPLILDDAVAQTLTFTVGGAATSPATVTTTVSPAALANYTVTQSSGGGHITVTAYDKYGNVQTGTTSAYVNYTAKDGTSGATTFTAGKLVTASGNTTINANGSSQPDAITLSKGTATLAYTASAENDSTPDASANVTDKISAQSKGGSITSNTVTDSGL